jgi:hypothetical protein
MSTQPTAPFVTSAFDQLKCFLLIVGNARSGSTLLGAALDAHLSAMIGNESEGSWGLWKGMSRAQILMIIRENAERMAGTNRPSEGYQYQIGHPPGAKQNLLVVGDKTWNPSVLFMHGNGDLLPDFEQRAGLPVKVIESVRNPFDVIASMHRRSGLPVRDRTRWFFLHCEATAALGERLPAEKFTVCHHGDFLADPEAEITRLCRFLDLPGCDEHLAAVKKVLLPEPRRTSASITWDPADVAEIKRRMAGFDVLNRYINEGPGFTS